MQKHLTDSQLMEALGGEPEGEARVHLAGCPNCRADRDRLRAALTGLVEQSRAQAERPEAIWEQQRRQIVSRLSRRPSSWRFWGWTWAPAAVGLAVVALFWFRGGPPQSSQGPEADHALLIAVERSAQAEVPVALRPVALLAAEVERRGMETGQGIGIPTGDQP